MRLLFALALAASPAPAQQVPVVQLNAGMHLIRAEVAADYATRMTGLMHRASMPSNAGMLFIFDETTTHCMWMKSMPAFDGIEARCMSPVMRLA